MLSRGKLIWLILGTVLLSAGVYLVGNDRVALFDRDEPRYAQCSREMLQSGDYVVPRFLGEVRTAKPPFIYWCQVAAMKWLGDTPFAARLPSGVAMTLVLALWSIAIWKLAGPQRAGWSTFILATSVMTIAAAKGCLTDAVLLLWITIAQLCLYAIYRGRRSWWIIATMGIAIGLAGLTKGPVVLAVLAMTIVALLLLRLTVRQHAPARLIAVDPEKQLLSSFFKTVLLLVLVVAIVGPWLYLIEKRSPGFLGVIIGHDVVKRMKTGLEGHAAPPGYHLATIWGVYFPWAIFLPMSIVWAWKRRHLPLVRFALATVLGSWVFFELVKTKLPHYLLPIYPWLALLLGDVIVRGLRGLMGDLTNNLTRGAMTVWGGIVIVLGLLPWLLWLPWWRYPLAPWMPTMALTGTTLIIGSAIIYCFRWRPKPVDDDHAGAERSAAPDASTATVSEPTIDYASTDTLKVHRVVANSRQIREQSAYIRTGFLVLGLGNFALVLVLFGVFLPSANKTRASITVANELKRLGATAPNSVWMLDYKEPSLAFYQGGTIREHRNLKLTAELAQAAPPFLVITDKVWNASNETVQAMFDVKFTTDALMYADRMRRVKVMIVQKR